MSHSTQITYTIIKETRLENQIGNKIRAGNYCQSSDINCQERICLVLPKQLIAMQRWQGGFFGTTKWLLYIFRTGSKVSCKNLVPGVFPQVDLLFFCFGATRVKRTLKLLDSLTNSDIEFSGLSNDYWLHQNARIQIFKENKSKNHPDESLPFNSMTALMKSISKKISGKKTKKYQFTGNRAMAKRVRGNSYILHPPSYYRLSVIKSRIVKSKSWHTVDEKILAVNEHIKYLVRHEVAIDGKSAKFFDNESDDVDGKKFAIDLAQDRHHFRFIVSPENSLEIDLKTHARNLVNQMEQDLGIKLKWIGVVHQNTDNPHVHLIIKGTELNGKDLIIKPDYISHGMRFRSRDLLTRELGPRSELSIAKAK